MSSYGSVLVSFYCLVCICHPGGWSWQRMLCGGRAASDMTHCRRASQPAHAFVIMLQSARPEQITKVFPPYGHGCGLANMARLHTQSPRTAGCEMQSAD